MPIAIDAHDHAHWLIKQLVYIIVHLDHFMRPVVANCCLKLVYEPHLNLIQTKTNVSNAWGLTEQALIMSIFLRFYWFVRTVMVLTRVAMWRQNKIGVHGHLYDPRKPKPGLNTHLWSRELDLRKIRFSRPTKGSKVLQIEVFFRGGNLQTGMLFQNVCPGNTIETVDFFN